MSLDLERELTELAGQARRYDDVDSVMRTVHRRRRGRVTTAAAAVATVLAVFAVVVVQHGARPEPVGPALGEAAPAIPSTVDEPATPVAMLPTDRAVGRSSLVYQASAGGPAYLVEPDGSQYQVPIVALTGPNLIARYRNLPLSLSPDGRWLVIVGDDATRIRDLTSTVVRSIAAMSMPEAWSPDGRWLVVLGPAGRTLLEVSSGRTWTLPVPADGNHVLPADDGQIVSVPAVGGGHTLILGRLDPVHGSPAHAIVVTATDQLTAGETIGWHLRVVPEDCAGDTTWASSLDGDRLLLGVFMVPTVTDCATTTDPGSPVGYVLASASTGQVLGRVNLPAGAGTPLWRDGDLVYASQSTPTDRISVQTVEDTGHNHRPLTSLPATSIFVLSGAVSPMVGPATR